MNAEAISILIDKGIPETGIAVLMHPRLNDYDEREKWLFRKAFNYALENYMLRYRKSGEPYFYHIMRGVLRLLTAGFDATTVIAYILHETIEDDGKDLGWLTTEFGFMIALVVDGLSKRPKNKRDPNDRRNRIKHCVNKIRHLICITWRILVDKIVDKLDNTTDTQGLTDKEKEYLFTETVIHFLPLFEDFVDVVPDQFRPIVQLWILEIHFACHHYKTNLRFKLG